MTRRRRNPPLPPIDRSRSMAVDHVRKFVRDELVIEPKAFLRLSALGRIYGDWCEMHGVMNRRVSVSEVLLRLERDYGLTCGVVYIRVGQDDEGKLYGLRGARLRLPELNGRGRYAHRHSRTERGASPARWAPVVAGRVPDIADRFAGDDESTDVDEEDA
jgi:hypothetical protein